MKDIQMVIEVEEGVIKRIFADSVQGHELKIEVVDWDMVENDRHVIASNNEKLEKTKSMEKLSFIAP